MSALRSSVSSCLRRIILIVVAFGVLACLGAAPAAAAAGEPPIPCETEEFVHNCEPEVVGKAVVGERLICASGTWEGVSEFTYGWLRNGVPIPEDATNQYIVAKADEGSAISCVVTGHNSYGSVEDESVNKLEIPGERRGPPVNTEAPRIKGTPKVGEKLECTKGSWHGNPPPTAFAYQWLRDGKDIETQTTSAYTVVEADAGHFLACTVTATSSEGGETYSTSKTSESVKIVGSPPKNLKAPKVNGNVVVGETLTCSKGEWSGAPEPTYTYVWRRGTEAISTANLYTIVAADQGQSLLCEVTASNGEGSPETKASGAVRVPDSKPENTKLPEILGAPEVNKTLECTKGTWSAIPEVPASGYHWRWFRETSEIAEGQTYEVRSADETHTLTCIVTATNSEGVGVSAESAAVFVKAVGGTGGSPPKNKVAPEITGSTELGKTLECHEGEWTGSPKPKIGYQWLREGKNIETQTASSYRVTEADEGHLLACRVTATNSEGTASAESKSVTVPGVKPANAKRPWIEWPEWPEPPPTVGQTLTCLRGEWKGTPAPSFSYQWQRGAEVIGTGETYVTKQADAGQTVACAVTATQEDAEGKSTASATSEGVEIEGVSTSPPQMITPPSVTGTPEVGKPLTCQPGTWSGNPELTYQWFLEEEEIRGATGGEYVVVVADRGGTLSCEVTATNPEGQQSALSEGMHVAGSAPEDVQPPYVTGVPDVGESLTCIRGKWNGEPSPAFKYQWMLNGEPIESASATSSYVIVAADKGQTLSCRVTATNSAGSAEAVSSNQVEVSTGATKATVKKEEPVNKAPTHNLPPVVTNAQLIASMSSQLTSAGKHAHIKSLLKHGSYTFNFAALAAGTLELSWAAPQHGGHASSKRKPVVLAASTVVFTDASTKAVKLRLTSAGRRLLAHSTRVKLTLKGVFVRAPGVSVSWQTTLELSR